MCAQVKIRFAERAIANLFKKTNIGREHFEMFTTYSIILIKAGISDNLTVKKGILQWINPNELQRVI
jgi:hypothetical protein